VGIILFGGKETKNYLNDEHPNEYKNLSIAAPIEPVNLNLMKCADAIRCDKGVADCDFLDSLILAIDMLKTRCGTKKYSKRIFLVTDASFSSLDEHLIQAIISGAKREGIIINVISVDFMSSELDQVKSEKDAETPKYKNEQALYKICQATPNGVVLDTQTSIGFLSAFRGKKVNQTTLFRCALEIGNNVKIPVYGYKKTDTTKFPSAKKRSKVAPDSADGVVVAQRSFFALDNPDEEVPDDKQVKAYKYGKNFVPFNKVDESFLKGETEKCLKILGFTDRNAVPRMYMKDLCMGFFVCFY